MASPPSDSSPWLEGSNLGGGDFAWSSDDALLYAISVGAGDAAGDLPYVTENSLHVKQRVLPTMLLLPCADLPLDQLNLTMEEVVHGGQKFVMHEELSTEGSVSFSTTVSSVRDLGRHAAIELHTTFRDSRGGRLIGESWNNIVARGYGGFATPTRAPSTADDLPPLCRLTVDVASNQALLYRLNGDRNPLHSDPVVANRAGFERPILHGLGTFGMLALTLMREFCGSDASRLASLEVRFRKPVHPGDTLVLDVRGADGLLAFDGRVGDDIVLQTGLARLRT